MSFDIISLYTSIDIQEGIEAIKGVLQQTTYTVPGQNLLVDLLTFILTHNYFMFEKQFYIQCQGTAMGADVAPSFANIFVATLEERYIYVSHHLNKIIKGWRYIDEVFAIWAGSVEELQDFHQYLNGINGTVKFTVTYSLESITFLDTLVAIKDGSLSKELFQKKMDKNTLLHYTSGHPKRMIKSLPYKHFLRARRITQNPDGVIRGKNPVMVKW